MDPNNRPQSEFVETVIEINRISKKTKGGNQIRFSALVVVGDKKGKVGVGLDKAPNVVSGIRKAITQARKNMISIPMRGSTIPYEVRIKYGAARLLLKPAPSGSGVVAGGPLRAVFESAGVHDIVAKILGSNNKTTNLYAAMKALMQLSDWRQTQEARRANRKGSKNVNT
ncbi:MAG: 30S ribosomal protein S5 [Candidatus Blackburnbacteria bacterium]|nr:30S ribosomal protein S5 [Candidatus Blackburnbacteria bacterium]